jgi:hypothetical protein
MRCAMVFDLEALKSVSLSLAVVPNRDFKLPNRFWSICASPAPIGPRPCWFVRGVQRALLP